MIDFIIYNYPLKKNIHKLLNSNFLNNSQIYNYFLNKKVKNVISRYKKTPSTIRIENTNICNANCIMCPRDEMNRKQGVMSDDIFKKIVDEAVDLNIEYINLHNFGEPLIDKDISKKIEYAKEKGIKKVSTNTNTHFLTKEFSKKLLEVKLDELYVSIDAFSKDTYEKVRVGLKYDVLIDNLMNFLELKKELNSDTKLIVSFVQTKDNIEEIDDFIEFWKNKADKVSVSFAHDWAGSGKDKIKNVRLSQPCKLLFTDLTVAWNGDYLLCCADYNSSVKLPNIKDLSLKEFWINDEILNKYRNEHINNYGFNISPCKECTLNTIWWI